MQHGPAGAGVFLVVVFFFLLLTHLNRGYRTSHLMGPEGLQCRLLFILLF